MVGNRLLADMARARSEAVMSRYPSVVCPSTDGSTCSGASDWSNGWIVFTDRDGDDRRSAPEPLLSFPSGALIHFAVSNKEVAMVTKLVGLGRPVLSLDQWRGCDRHKR